MTTEMSCTKGLLKRSNSYYFQARIPKDCLAHYAVPVIRECLNTLDKAQAVRLIHQRWVELLEEFDRIRKTGSRFKHKLTPEDTKRIIGKALASRLQSDDVHRETGMDDFEYELASTMHAEADSTERKVIARGVFSEMTLDMADEWLFSDGFDIPRNSPEFKKFAGEFVKAQSKVTKAFMARHQGEVVETEEVLSDFAVPKARSTAPQLSVVVNYFLENYDTTKPMYKKHKSFLPVFLSYIGDRPVDEIRQIDLNEFAKVLCKLPPRWTEIVRKTGQSIVDIAAQEHSENVSPKTFEDTYMASLRPFLKAAKRIYGDSGFPHNLTTEGLVYTGKTKDGEQKQRAFTAEELRKLFEGTEFAKFAADPESHHQYWLPLIGLFTGARVNEICQLNPQEDIRLEDGIPIFDFREDGETDERVTRSIKNKTSVRTVPIHPRLLELGFLDYAERVKQAGAKLLFPAWSPFKGRASGEAEKWFRSFLEETGLRDETPAQRIVGMHAFRHTFLNRAFNLDVQNAEVITGHAGSDSEVVRGYKGKLQIRKLLTIIEQVDFDIRPVAPVS